MALIGSWQCDSMADSSDSSTNCILLYINQYLINMFSKKADTLKETESLVEKRNQHTEQMRKHHREQIITKRRNFNINIDKQSLPNIEEQTKADSDSLGQKIEQFLKKTYTISDFMYLVSCLHCDDIIKLHDGIIGIRKLLSVQKNSPIQSVIDANLVPKMIQFMKQTKYSRLQMEATWALTNVASGTSLQCQSIIDKGGIPLFIKLLESKNLLIAEQAIWAIGNIAGDSTFNRDLILKAGGLKPLRNVIQTCDDKNLIKNGSWAMSNLCRGNPLPKFELVKESIGTFGKVIANNLIDQLDVITDCIWALSYLSDGPKQYYKKIIETGVVEKIVTFLNVNLDAKVIVPSLRILGNLVSGTVPEADEILKYNPTPALEALLEFDKKVVRKQICWIFSNICAGDLRQVLIVLKNDSLMKKIVSMLDTDYPEVKRQICWMFSNLTTKVCPEDLIILFKHYSVMKVFAGLIFNDHTGLLEVTLDALHSIFESGQKAKINGKNVLVEQFNSYNTIDQLEKLQYHRSQDIYNKTINILQDFYQIQDPLN